MAFCEGCGTENRNKALFCMGCAKAMAPLAQAGMAGSPEAVAALEPARAPVQACPVCQCANPLAATVCTSCRGSLVPDVLRTSPQVGRSASRGLASKPLGVMGLALVALVAGWWWSAQGVTGNAQVLASSPPLSQAAAPAPTAVPVGAADALSAASARPPAAHVAAAPALPSADEKVASEKARVKRQAAAQARREQVAQERAATEEKARAAMAVEQQQANEAARAKAAAEVAQRVVLATTRQSIPTPMVKTVEQICASSGNFFSSEACRLRSCGDAALVSDPVCVRLREMEEANRRAMAN